MTRVQHDLFGSSIPRRSFPKRLCTLANQVFRKGRLKISKQTYSARRFFVFLFSVFSIVQCVCFLMFFARASDHDERNIVSWFFKILGLRSGSAGQPFMLEKNWGAQGILYSAVLRFRCVSPIFFVCRIHVFESWKEEFQAYGRSTEWAQRS